MAMLFKFDLDNIAVRQYVGSDEPVLEATFEVRNAQSRHNTDKCHNHFYLLVRFGERVDGGCIKKINLTKNVMV